MSYFVSRSRNFSNRRDWRDYLSRAQCAVASPMITDALKAGRAWLSQASENASWATKVKPLGREFAADIVAATGLDEHGPFKAAF